jgi:hypothetical protein
MKFGVNTTPKTHFRRSVSAIMHENWLSGAIVDVTKKKTTKRLYTGGLRRELRVLNTFEPITQSLYILT